ncbi:MAG: hypothetical protein MJZ18_04200 [Bacteroidales bacterium]|nr:hypothetical protein [Bacteroidales bacterium]
MVKRTAIITFVAIVMLSISFIPFFKEYNEVENTTFVSTNDTTQFIYFENGKIKIKVYLEGNPYFAIFDTASDLYPVFDIETFSSLRDTLCERKIKISNAWSGKYVDGVRVDKEIEIVLPTLDTLRYPKYELCEFNNSSDIKIMLSIPSNETRVVNLDYGTRHIKVLKQVPKSILDNNDIKSPIFRDGGFLDIKIPFSFVDDRDTLNIELQGLVDTGCLTALSCLGGLPTTPDYTTLVDYIKKHYIASDRTSDYYLLNECCQINEPFVFESNNRAGYIAGNVFGNNLLCHYNLFFDLKNNVLYGEKIDSVMTPDNILCDETSMKVIYVDNGVITSFLGKDCQYIRVGFRIGDLIVSFDGNPAHQFSKEYLKNNKKTTFEIIREDHKISIEMNN